MFKIMSLNTLLALSSQYHGPGVRLQFASGTELRSKQIIFFQKYTPNQNLYRNVQCFPS